MCVRFTIESHMAKATSKIVEIDIDAIADQTPVQIVPAPQPKLKRVCGTCSNWLRMSGPTMGQCKLSARAMPMMMVTTDLSSCSGWNELKP